MPHEETEEKVPLNTLIPLGLDQRIRLAIVTLGLNMQKGVKFLYTFGLYIQENFDFKKSKEVARHSFPIVCLTAARNDLEKMGVPGSTILKIDQAITEAQEHLSNK